MVFTPCWYLRDISAPLSKGWAPQESLGGALFIHAHLRGSMGGTRHPTLSWPPLPPEAQAGLSWALTCHLKPG